MERRLAALEREAREQASSTRLLMELVEDSMPVSQCHELLAGMEERLARAAAASTPAESSSKPPAAAAASDGRSAVVDALRDDVDKLLRSQTNLEQVTRGLGGRLERLEDEQKCAEHSMEDVLCTSLAESEQRVREELTEALGQELAAAVQEMANIAEATQRVAEQSVQTLTDRLEQAEGAAVHTNKSIQKLLREGLEQTTASFNSALGQHETDLAKLRASSAQESQRSSHLLERLQAEIEECREQNLGSLSELRALEETLYTKFEANETNREEEADGLLGQIKAFVTEQLQESERRQQQQASEFLETRLASVSLQAAEQNNSVHEQMRANEATWQRTRQDDAGHIERAIRTLEQVICEQGSEYKRDLSSLESTLNHNMKLQADTHERQCAELKREIADASAALRRDQSISIAQAQLEGQSSNRDITLLRHELEQVQLGVESTMDEIIARNLDERRESLLQVDARIVQMSTESRDMLASAKRSFERQIEHAKDTLTRQLVEGDTRDAAERERLSSQVEEAVKIVKCISKEEVAARTSLAQSVVQQIAESAAAAASTTDALQIRIDALKIELEGMVARESAAHGALVQSVRTDLVLQLDKRISEVSASLYEHASEFATRIAAVETKATGRMERLQAELKAHCAESVLAMSTQDERLSNTAVELTTVLENHTQTLRADMVSRSTAVHDSLKQAMAEVDKSLSSKADTTVVEQRHSQLNDGLEDAADKLRLLSNRLQLHVDSSSAANNHLRDEFVTTHQAVQTELRATDKSLRGDFLKSSLGIRNDFATADSKMQKKLVGLIVEVRQRLEETTRSYVSKSEIQIQLGTVKLDLDETRSAVEELEERTEEMRLQSSGVQAELAELAVELSLMDATTATMALSL